jgi:hypothetical protein
MFSLSFFSGCVMSGERAHIIPGANISSLKSFYVAKNSPDNMHGVDQLICDDLKLRGYAATSGLPFFMPTNVDAIVMYKDVWYWNFGESLPQLHIDFLDSKGGHVLASSDSFHGWEALKTPPKMVSLALDAIFTATNAPRADHQLSPKNSTRRPHGKSE